MPVTVTIEFVDDVAPVVERWPDSHAAMATATRWAKVMEGLNPGARVRFEWECEMHGHEPLTLCGTCGWPTCIETACPCVDEA